MSAIRIQPFHFTSSPPSTIPLAKEIFEAIFQNETVSLQRAFLACKNIDAASLFSETSKTHLLNLNPSSLNDLLEKHLVYLNLRKTVALFAKINSSLFPSLVLQSNQVNLLLENEMSLLIHSNSSILPDFIKMFSDSQLYFKLEPFFTDFATSKYSSISKQLMQDLDMNDKISSFRKYINTTNIEIDLITEKVDSGYLHASSKKLVLEILDSILIKTNSPSLVEFGFQALLDSNEIALLKQFIALLSRVDELDLVLKSLHKYISSNVEEFLKLDDMIEKILVFKRLIDRVALEAFSNSDSVLETVKKSFSSSINKQQNKPAELLARQMDKLLKQKVQSTSLLNEYLVLFRYISAKDVFEAFFQKDLAKRLLLSKSNLDNEMELVSLLKIECGGLFTSKLEGMFKDIEVSREISTNFKALNVSPFDFNVIVLSSAFWPTYPITSITLPRSVFIINLGY